MLHFLYHISNLSVFLILSIFFISISLISVLLVNWLIPLDLRRKDNSVIGDIGALISIIFGVLIGLTALHLINNIGNTDDAVQHEVYAVTDLYRNSQWLQDPTKTGIQTAIKNYLNQVIHAEWPMMKAGEEQRDNTAVKYINDISNLLSHYQVSKSNEQFIIPAMLSDLKDLYNFREQRIHLSFSELNPELWGVIFLGTFLTLGINYLFGMNIYLHLISISAIALMASSMLFLLITIDRPFQGEFVVKPDAFHTLLQQIANQNNNLGKN